MIEPWRDYLSVPSKVNSYKNNPCCFHLSDANI